MTQRTRNVPIFDFFDLTTKYVDPPLQGFDIQMDAYTRLKYNFEGVYSLMDSLANTANDFVSKNIQTPIQKGTNLVTSGLNNNNINNGIQNIPNLNINGYLPSDDSGSLDYTTAYKTLTNGLLAFKQQAQTDDDKKLLSQIDDISRTINADGNVTPASKELYQAKAEADGIVDQTRKQINSIADQVKNYDTFIQGVDKNQIQLVKADDMQTSISSPLIKGNTTTQQLIAQQEAPMTSYLNLNKGLVAGYTKALDNSSPEELNMTSDTYKRSQKLLADLDQQIGAMSDTTTLQTTPSTSTEENSKLKTSNNLLATNTCTNCQGGVPENGYQQDLSSYVHGVFVDTGSGTGKTMVNVVNNNNFISNIGKNYLQTDMNNDHKDDILLRDANNVYIKYAEQNSEHLSLGGYQLTTHFTNYYVYQNH